MKQMLVFLAAKIDCLRFMCWLGLTQNCPSGVAPPCRTPLYCLCRRALLGQFCVSPGGFIFPDHAVTNYDKNL